MGGRPECMERGKRGKEGPASWKWEAGTSASLVLSLPLSLARAKNSSFSRHKNKHHTAPVESSHGNLLRPHSDSPKRPRSQAMRSAADKPRRPRRPRTYTHLGHGTTPVSCRLRCGSADSETGRPGRQQSGSTGQAQIEINQSVSHYSEVSFASYL